MIGKFGTKVGLRRKQTVAGNQLHNTQLLPNVVNLAPPPPPGGGPFADLLSNEIRKLLSPGFAVKKGTSDILNVTGKSDQMEFGTVYCTC